MVLSPPPLRYLKQRWRQEVPGADDLNKDRTGNMTLSGPALNALVVDVLTFSKDKKEAAEKWTEYGITLNCFSDANLIEVMKSMLSCEPPPPPTHTHTRAYHPHCHWAATKLATARTALFSCRLLYASCVCAGATIGAEVYQRLWLVPMRVVKTKNKNKGRLSTDDGAIINTKRPELLTPTSTAAEVSM